MNPYAQLLQGVPFGVAAMGLEEKKGRYAHFSEKYLQVMWWEQKYFKSLSTFSGERIEVVSPGIWNGEAGPDFRKAHVIIGGRELRGDVEIHLVDENWYVHQHDVDEKYNDVVLHLSLWHPRVPKPVHTQAGNEIVRAYFEDALSIPLARIIQLIDLDLYPYKKFMGSGKCSQQLFRHLARDEIMRLFASAAAWRLARKYSYLQARAGESLDLLLAGIAMGLGYKQNAESFLELFKALQADLGNPAQVFSEELLLAKAMGICGFFSEKFQVKWGTSVHYQRLLGLWKGMAAAVDLRIVLTLHHIRPFNHPVRRLAFLTKLMVDPKRALFYDSLLATWQAFWPACQAAKKWTACRRALEDFFPNYSDPYWNFHYTFAAQPTLQVLSLIGADAKQEIVINTFLPLLQHHVQHISQNELEKRAFVDFYASFPAHKTSKTKYLVHRFFGNAPKGNILNKAQMEQGAYQLHHDFCVHFEASCEGCPFVERYKEASRI